jgi:hypothetical protein
MHQQVAKAARYQPLAVEADRVVLMYLGGFIDSHDAVNTHLAIIYGLGGFASRQCGAFTNKFIQAHYGLHQGCGDRAPLS